jgi:hypothetical protein
MDNDILINQARRLYTALQVEQYTRGIANKARLKRLDHAVIGAYCRYQRRLNRCVLCYQFRTTDCVREFLKNKPKFCPKRSQHSNGSKR